MNQDVADAISVIEKQMAEKDQKIAALEHRLDAFEKAVADWNVRCGELVGAFQSAADYLAKELAK